MVLRGVAQDVRLYPEAARIPSICRIFTVCSSACVRVMTLEPSNRENLLNPRREESVSRRQKGTRGMLRLRQEIAQCRVHSPIELVKFADSLPHISLRMTRSAWTTPDQRVCWLGCRDLMQVVFKSHVGDARLEMRRRIVMLDAHQVRMPYMRGIVVDAGGVVVSVEGERGGFRARDGGLAGYVDYLRRVVLRSVKKKKNGCYFDNKIFLARNFTREEISLELSE